MADVKKFMFDTHDFDDDKDVVVATVYSEEQLAIARDQAFAQGKAEALQEARSLQEARLTELLEKMLIQADALAGTEDRRDIEKSVDAVKTAMAITRKLMPQFAQTHALPEIENAILAAVDARKEEPRLTVTVPAAHLDALKDRMDKQAAARGFHGIISLVADDALPFTDCRVEWADGGMDRIYEQLVAQIEDKLHAAVATMKSSIE